MLVRMHFTIFDIRKYFYSNVYSIPAESFRYETLNFVNKIMYICCIHEKKGQSMGHFVFDFALI